MIELDYNNENELIQFVEKTKYFDQPLINYKSEFENSRPKVIGIKEFENGNRNVNPETKIITLLFSQPMNIQSRGFDYGPLGEGNVLGVQKIIGYSDDKKSFTFEVNLEPERQYQSIATENFTDESGLPLHPFLIDFTTSK